ncbi:MAG TPA: hypothetical protein VH250_08310, partial [Granulicella sp.]|nr:hypothetical protein [Granulicella sp.]
PAWPFSVLPLLFWLSSPKGICFCPRPFMQHLNFSDRLRLAALATQTGVHGKGIQEWRYSRQMNLGRSAADAA